ncbi:hypothetical protein P22_1054 [Propionispora sp. 2/2-37]|uniref:HD domain-containing protein n=1 Tax=Propionispora sp. 2/2-37 TaxID=1677858 RepID=UPI0006BB61DE|nr:HD domain-containing protein [Propionispora sp. 2/2-37]CUH94985.1 hypothetical protein P22_1054 [Propionispora sp. 2/2-37]
MIRKTLLEFIHESAHIQRWNDHIRPKGFTELDKQAQKMVIAYCLARFEEGARDARINWRGIIEGGFFEFLHRIVLTDIKPPVYHELMASHGKQLNTWVLAELEPRIECLGQEFRDRFAQYLTDPNCWRLEKKILKAAHYLATHWEFQIIRNLNSNIYGLDETQARIENEIEEHYDLIGVQKVSLGKKTNHFINLVGQLRFQQRWAQSPRVPETSVMGHMLIVAIMSYLISLEVKACDQRAVNNYFAGLFHDLPEVLTRDIVSPVKRAVAGLDELIKQIENRQVQEKIFPLVPASWQSELNYFLQNEFTSKIILNGQVKVVSSADIGRLYNQNRYSPIDGEFIKACDHLAAYMEANLSKAHGIMSRHLQDGIETLYQLYQNKVIADVDFGQLFDYFK